MKSIDTSYNLCKITEDYFDKMLKEIEGIKGLVLDKETTRINNSFYQ